MTGQFCCAQNYKFTGMERDAETINNDHTWFRSYASNLGRWLSPDPLGGSIVNPQSFNRYAYVRNNPTTLIDPLGLGDVVPCGHAVPCGVGAGNIGPPPTYIGIDGGAPIDLGSGLVGSSESTGVCTGGNCDFPSAYSSGNPGNQGTYYPVFGVNGMVWMTGNGEDLSDESVAELGLPSLDGSDPGAASSGGASSGGPVNGGTGCNAKESVRFIHTNKAAAATVARQLGIPTENVLGLSGIESTWGRNNAAIQANNFFGLHGGANAPFATGVWYTSGGTKMSSFPSYLASAQSFAAQYGSYVQGVTNPTAFAQSLVQAGFNSGRLPGGNPNFVRDTARVIKDTAGRMPCP